jgi:hypothetical protein
MVSLFVSVSIFIIGASVSTTFMIPQPDLSAGTGAFTHAISDNNQSLMKRLQDMYYANKTLIKIP